MSNVTTLFGETVNQSEPSPAAIRAIEDLLERVKAGDVVGVAYASLHSDGTGSYGLSGQIGSYAALGALELAKAQLSGLMLDEYE